MRAPPFGLCVPVEPVRVRDSDTIEVRVVGTALVWAIRLLDVWAPELRRGEEDSKAIAREGKLWLEQILAKQTDLRLHVALPTDKNILKALTFDRVVGTIYCGGGDNTLNKMIVSRGYASSTKGGKLGQ